jgi:hypothetical protein
MSRNDIADSLGLTIETVCRTLSLFRRDHVIAIPNPHRIELLDRDGLEAIGEAWRDWPAVLIQVSAGSADSGSYQSFSRRAQYACPLGAPPS